MRIWFVVGFIANRARRWMLYLAAATTIPSDVSRADDIPLEQRRWYETQTAHFNIFSCGSAQDVYHLAVRLEQFREAYAQLAGAQSVESPPIIVLAFPDHETLKPYLPLYHGIPGNLAGFFVRAADENLIVLSLPEPGSTYTGMEVIFHEYTHLLFRRNDQIWPLWLKEGMAELYSTFHTEGRIARVADPIAHHLRVLDHSSILPLDRLFDVSQKSADYNESDRQGRFYAESWLLTHFLVTGDNKQYRAGFEQFTARLRHGEMPLDAFTNSLRASLPAIESELRRYLKRGVFAPVDFQLPASLTASVGMKSRYLTPVEIYFRLGDEQVRVNRINEASALFNRAQRMAPASPLPYEGLGLVAHQRDEHEQAIKELKTAIDHGSKSYLTHYLCALEKFRSAADSDGRYRQVPAPLAAEISARINQSILLMPSFGPAHQLCGIFEMVQGLDTANAAAHLQRAVQLEPGNASYILSLAQYQFVTHHDEAARQTIAQLLYPTADPKIRDAAGKLIEQFEKR